MPDDSRDLPEFPPCTRCGHTIEEHVRPEGKRLPWPCRKCDCPGFVVARELKEDVKHMATLRLENAVAELYPEHLSADEIQQKASDVIQRIDNL